MWVLSMLHREWICIIQIDIVLSFVLWRNEVVSLRNSRGHIKMRKAERITICCNGVRLCVRSLAFFIHFSISFRIKRVFTWPWGVWQITLYRAYWMETSLWSHSWGIWMHIRNCRSNLIVSFIICNLLIAQVRATNLSSRFWLSWLFVTFTSIYDGIQIFRVRFWSSYWICTWSTCWLLRSGWLRWRFFLVLIDRCRDFIRSVVCINQPNRLWNVFFFGLQEFMLVDSRSLKEIICFRLTYIWVGNESWSWTKIFRRCLI